MNVFIARPINGLYHGVLPSIINDCLSFYPSKVISVHVYRPVLVMWPTYFRLVHRVNTIFLVRTVSSAFRDRPSYGGVSRYQGVHNGFAMSAIDVNVVPLLRVHVYFSISRAGPIGGVTRVHVFVRSLGEGLSHYPLFACRHVVPRPSLPANYLRV